MATSPRFKFTATVVVSVLAAVLTLTVGDDNESPEGLDRLTRLASQLPPTQR